MIKPEPNDCDLLFLFSGLSNCLKNSSKGEPGGKDGIFLDFCSITVVVDILTTEGLNFSAKSAKLSGVFLAYEKLIENKIKNLRTLPIEQVTNDTQKASLVCLINNVRQIKDRKGKPLMFINFSDGTGSMDGIISSDVMENCHSIIKEGEIVNLKGLVELDDYRSKELGNTMFRMRIREAKAIDNELIRLIKDVIIDVQKSDATSLEDFSAKLDSINKEFWLDGSCSLNVKVMSEQSEAIIDLGDDYKFSPSLKNLTYLEDIFGKNILEIKK